MWRPDLHPLPCRVSVDHETGADGRHSFVVLEAVPSGTVLVVSLCVEVPVIAVDQFPFLWDFVLTGETQNVNGGCQSPGVSSCLHSACVFAAQDEGKVRELPKWVLYFISPLALLQCPNL